jgi:mercuric ion binding protein
MNILISVVVGTLGLMAGIAGCLQHKAEAIETAKIQVKTIQCDMCVATIEKAVSKLDGVKEILVDLDAKVASVEFFPARVQLSQIETAIAGAGYDANQTKRNDEAYARLPACCQ